MCSYIWFLEVSGWYPGLSVCFGIPYFLFWEAFSFPLNRSSFLRQSQSIVTLFFSLPWISNPFHLLFFVFIRALLFWLLWLQMSVWFPLLVVLCVCFNILLIAINFHSSIVHRVFAVRFEVCLGPKYKTQSFRQYLPYFHGVCFYVFTTVILALAIRFWSWPSVFFVVNPAFYFWISTATRMLFCFAYKLHCCCLRCMAFFLAFLLVIAWIL